MKQYLDEELNLLKELKEPLLVKEYIHPYLELRVKKLREKKRNIQAELDHRLALRLAAEMSY